MAIRLFDRSEHPWTTVPDSLAQDSDLSWKARGILLYLLSLPEEWTVRKYEIAENATDGSHALESGLDELEEAGYLERERVRNDGGQFSGYHYFLRLDGGRDE